jgi:hypothetical protein
VKIGHDSRPIDVAEAFHASFGVIYERLRALYSRDFSDVLLLHVLQQTRDTNEPHKEILPNYVTLGAAEQFHHWHESIRVAKALAMTQYPKCPPVSNKDLEDVLQLVRRQRPTP